MLCAIYRSERKEGMYLYVAKRDQFDAVPDSLMKVFGRPQFVMLFNLLGSKPLRVTDNQKVLRQIKERGFYLQLPEKEENLLERLRRRKST